MEKYLYFRTEATDADDDARGDSACWPVSSFMGMQPVGDTELGLYFKPMRRGVPSGNEPDADASFDNNDSVILNLTSANTHLVAMQKIASAINSANAGGIIVVANDDSDGTKVIAKSGIASCGTISVSPAYAN